MKPLSRALVFLTYSILVLWFFHGRSSQMDGKFYRSGRRAWQKIAEEKRLRDMAKIPKHWILDRTIVENGRKRRSITGEFIEDLLDSDTLRITRLNAPRLLQEMGSGNLTAVHVVTAFSKRAAYAHQLSNIFLEIGFDIALERARELDKYFKKHRKLVGPLHGLPVTLKDQFHITGLQTSMAYVGWIGTFEGQKNTGKEKVFESELVRELSLLGAIPIGKTTLVQTTWAPETNNNILGYSRNPHNQLLSTGGSSGGEGAIQALRGSAFGIGTDSGGSVGIPASFNGVYSIKPSAGRISRKGSVGSGSGQMVMPPVVGLLGPSIQTLRLVLKSLLSTEPWLRDPYVLPLPWRIEDEYRGTQELLPTFGLMKHDGIVVPHPPISRALRMVEEALRAEGHQIIPWEAPSNKLSMAIHGPISRGDGCLDAWQAIQLSGEPIVPQIENVFPHGKLKPPISLLEFENATLHMKEYREKYQTYWNSTADKTGNGRPVDAVILPLSPYAAVLPGKYLHSPYASFANVLDYATVVIPVTFANRNIDIVDPYYEPLNEKDKVNMESYDADVYHGAPASIQLLGRRLEEEKLLSIAQVVVDALERYKAKRTE